jgi:hypothetical protein
MAASTEGFGCLVSRGRFSLSRPVFPRPVARGERSIVLISIRDPNDRAIAGYNCR